MASGVWCAAQALVQLATAGASLVYPMQPIARVSQVEGAGVAQGRLVQHC